MKDLNIPIYRAKKIDSDEYVDGDLFYEKYIIAKSKLNTLIADAINHIEYDILQNKCINENCKIEHTQLKDMLNKLILNERFEHIYEINPATLAIHFPDTNIKDLFFGIDNGKGASIIEAKFISDNTPFKGVAMHTHYGYVFYDKNDDWIHITKLKDIKVIGIKE